MSSDWIQILAMGAGPKFINLALAIAIEPSGSGCIVQFAGGEKIKIDQPAEEILDAIGFRNSS